MPPKLDRPQGIVKVNDFPGMANNVDPMDLPPGAASLQINVTSQTPGRLESRKGYQIVKYEN